VIAVTSDRIPPELRGEILRAIRLAAHSGLMPGNQGNLSGRDPATGLVAITPHDLPYDEMTVDDLVVVDLHGKRVSGDHEPSYDVLVHCTVYRERPTINAVMHTEPPYATAFGTVGLEIDAITTTGLKSANGTVPIMPFGSIRKEAFALDMLARMGERHAIVWGNHGVLVVAPSIQQALDRSMGVEFNAQVAAVARALGKPHSLAYLDASVVLA
jgi:L-ribulose-5-phosphate 4-epimerase